MIGDFIILVGVNVIGVRSGAGLQSKAVAQAARHRRDRRARGPDPAGYEVGGGGHRLASGRVLLPVRGRDADAVRLRRLAAGDVDGGRGAGRRSHCAASDPAWRGDRRRGVPLGQLGLLQAPGVRRGARSPCPCGRRDLGLGLARTDLLTTGVVVVDAKFFALTGLALPILLRRNAPPGRWSAWLTAVALAFVMLELLAIVGSVLQKDVRIVALTGLGWIVA